MSVYDKFPKSGGNMFLKFEDGVPVKLKLVNIESKEGDKLKPEFCDDKGMQVEFEFQREDGSQCFFTRKSMSGFGWQLQKEKIEAGDWVTITRTGAGADTRYAMTKSDAPSEGSTEPF